MKASLVFIDGTICDTRPRHRHMGTPDFYKDEEILKDLPVPGSVQCLQELTRQYKIDYQIHCRTDTAWWDRPAWNSKVRFQQPKTIMQGDDYCLFIQYLPIS